MSVRGWVGQDWPHPPPPHPPKPLVIDETCPVSVTGTVRTPSATCHHRFTRYKKQQTPRGAMSTNPFEHSAKPSCGGIWTFAVLCLVLQHNENTLSPVRYAGRQLCTMALGRGGGGVLSWWCKTGPRQTVWSTRVRVRPMPCNALVSGGQPQRVRVIPHPLPLFSAFCPAYPSPAWVIVSPAAPRGSPRRPFHCELGCPCCSVQRRLPTRGSSVSGNIA